MSVKCTDRTNDNMKLNLYWKLTYCQEDGGSGFTTESLERMNDICENDEEINQAQHGQKVVEHILHWSEILMSN